MRKSTAFGDPSSRRSMHPRTPSKMSRMSTAAPSTTTANRQSLGVRYSMAGKQSIGPGSTVKGTNKKRHTTKDTRGCP